MRKVYFLSLISFFLSCSCSNNNIAGVGSETDTGCTVAGLIQYSDSSAVVHAGVTLHDQRLIKKITLGKMAAAPVLIRSGSTFTNINGFFSFDSVDTGGYLVEVNDHDSLGAVLPATVKPKDTLVQVNGTLKRFGIIIGKVDTAGIGKNKNVSIFLPEIGRIITVDSAGNFIIKNLPVWNYQMRLAIQDTVVRLPLDSVLIPVKPADTTWIISFGSKSGTVILDGKIIENPNP
jgi:hypothetical protein